MVLHRHVNLGFAAQTDRGLVVPVIENAHELSIIEMAKALNELADIARAGKLTPAQMSGGTFTVSNYGAFGVDGGDMVINHPEAAILGTGRIADKPWVNDGELAVRKTITYSIAFDHRLIDGGEGAGFIRYLADLTENPTLLTAAL
jgi:2-oxoisovalerate dehydrogenase E2 component (dihydrolipoyl transacylase)